MRRFLVSCLVLMLAVVSLWGADDTTKAAATRKKLDKKVSVAFKDTLLRDVLEDLKEKVEGVGIMPDTKGGVNLNAKITYKAAEKPVTEVLAEICDKYDMGFYVISQQGEAYDGRLKLTRGKERGYVEGQGPKEKTKADDKSKDKAKEKTKEKAKVEDKPKTEEKPAEDDPEKIEADAARKLKFAKTLLADNKIEKAKDRLEEIVKRYGKTKAGEEAKKLLEKLDK